METDAASTIGNQANMSLTTENQGQGKNHVLETDAVSTILNQTKKSLPKDNQGQKDIRTRTEDMNWY